MAAKKSQRRRPQIIVRPAKHRTGRERISFGDSQSRERGRRFLRRLYGAGGRIAEFNKHGILFEDLWRLDLAADRDPHEAVYLSWLSRRGDFHEAIHVFRSAAQRLREIRTFGVPAGFPGGPSAIDLAVLAEKLAGTSRRPQGGVVTGVLASPWRPTVRDRLPQVADDLEEVAECLDRLEPELPWRSRGAPFNDREHDFWDAWEELARQRSKGPLLRLGRTMFLAIFGRHVSLRTVKRRLEEGRAKSRNQR